MSDFVSRLAARAVGEEPRARPPVAPASEVAPAVEPHVETPAARAVPAAAEVRSDVPEVHVERPPEPKIDAPAPVERVEPVDSRPPHEQVVATASPREFDAVEPAEPLASGPTQKRETRTIVAAAPVPGAPIVRNVFDTRIERVHTVSTVTADEPPVRVHIGRLEVRANLEQPAPKQRRSQPAASQGPALSDYLRGRRSA